MNVSPRPTTKTFVGPDSPHFTAEVEPADCPAWTEVDPGRYMPRRVRGSFHGRALG